MEGYRNKAPSCRNFRAILPLALICWAVVWAQSPRSETEIELAASVDREEFPQNETATLTVKLRWLGPQQAFEIEPLSPPSVDNLRIISSSSSVETRLEEGRQVTVRTYKFVLRGEAQGVGTIGRVEVNYRHAETGQASFLETQPIQLQVAPPKAKRELDSSLSLLLVIVVVVAFLVFTSIRFLVRRAKAASSAAVEPSPATLEERLAEKVNLIERKSQQLSSEHFYAEIRSITLDYLGEKHDVSVRSSTTGDVIAKLEQKQLPPELSRGLKRVFRICDQMRFGSGESSPEERREILTLLRQILELQA